MAPKERESILEIGTIFVDPVGGPSKTQSAANKKKTHNTVHQLKAAVILSGGFRLLNKVTETAGCF